MPRDQESNPAPRSLANGDTAPEFAFASGGAKLRSPALLQKGPVLLTFYRGAWCPCCQADLRSLADAMPELHRTGVTVLGVFHALGAEGPESIAQEYALDFPVVDDVDGATAEAFGIRYSDDELALMESETGQVPRLLQEGGPWIIPMQARYVIGSDGRIAHSELVFDYHERTEAMTLIPVLTGLAG